MCAPLITEASVVDTFTPRVIMSFTFILDSGYDGSVDVPR